MTLSKINVFFFSVFAFNMAVATETEQASPLVKSQQAAQILSRAFSSMSQAKDTGKFAESLKKDNIEVSSKTRAFFVKEFNTPAPKAYNMGEVLFLDFEDGTKIKIEVPSKDLVLINDIKVDVSSVDSMESLKTKITAALKSSNQSSMLDKVLNQLFPYANAGIGDFLAQNGGYVAAGVGLLLAINDKKAIGLSLIAGGMLYQILNKKKDGPSH